MVNAGNRGATGSFWTVGPCSAEDQDAEQTSVPVVAFRATSSTVQLRASPAATRCCLCPGPALQRLPPDEPRRIPDQPGSMP